LDFSLVLFFFRFQFLINYIFHHQCNHFTFYSVFIDTHDDPKIEGKQNEEFYRKESFEQVEKIKLSTIEYHFTRGPPQDFVYS
jgi:hypothetical protein